VNPDGTIDGPGPFSLKSYFEHMMLPTSWGDANVINALALFWEAKIVVVQAKDNMISETRFRCQECPLEKVDIVLVYNGESHYSAAS